MIHNEINEFIELKISKFHEKHTFGNVMNGVDSFAVEL